MKTVPTGLPQTAATRRAMVWRFTVLCALAGLLLGIFEAAMLRTWPAIDFLLVPDVGRSEWFIAPLLDMVCFGLWGLLQGWLAARWPRKLFLAILVAVDAATFAAFVVLRLRWLYTRILIRQITFGIDFLNTRAWFAAAFVGALLAVYFLWEPASRLAARFNYRLLRFLSWGLGLAAMVAVVGIGSFLLRPFPDSSRVKAASGAGAQRPNIIFIVLDTVRADHFSSYGYHRPTTPNLDRLARRGVLFENAIAPTSWTLPSHASMFTGLLPHQNGADWASPLPPGPWTLAEVLRSRGYTTAGFVANYDYCQFGWGFGRGFQTYGDSRQSLRHSLASTLAGITLIQPFYNRFVRFDLLERQDAGEMDQEVFRWFRHRPANPFFLFINYFDTHVQYYTQPPYNHRFGRMSNKLVHKLYDRLQPGYPMQKFTAGERASVIAGYDNCLAYLDAQVGRLLDFLAKSPEGKNTIVIITSDHGEAFGEHGYYSHGYSLYREVLHVPLIIAGPGIPRGVRIPHLVRTRELFSTVLDLAAGGSDPFSGDSLARFWKPGYTPRPFDNFVVSELVPIFNEAGKQAMLSLTTPRWQYIYHSDGRQELYNWLVDPLEQHDLADSAGAQTTMEKLYKQLIQLEANSSEPWRDKDYLFAQSDRGKSFLQKLISARESTPPPPPGDRLFIGASQALFKPHQSPFSRRPTRPDQDLLRTLPYH